MKKYFILTALIMFLTTESVFADMFSNPEELQNMQEMFYERPSSLISPNVEEVENDEPEAVPGNPLFKKTRIKITNFLREREYKRSKKLLEKQKSEDDEEEVDVDEKNDSIEKSDETLELSGVVREHVAPNEVQLDADNIDFDSKTSEFVATGSPILVFPPQKTTIKADKMIYNMESNKLRAFGNVEVIRDGNTVLGDYFQVNMNEEIAMMDNIKTDAAFMTVTARTSDMDEKFLTLYDGKMVSEHSYILRLRTEMIGGNNFDRMFLKDDEKSSISDVVGDTAVNIKAKEIFINAKKDHDTITLKKARVNYGDCKLFDIRSLTVHTNKKHEFFEANYPELGSTGRLGMFAGPGFVFDTPLQNGSTLKLIPIINNQSGIGFGGMLKYHSATNYSTLAYGSAASIFMVKGRQNLDDKLYLQYGSNSYMDEWFLGPRMAKYNAELIYKDSTKIPSFLGENLDLKFKQRAGIGYMHNNEYNRYDENFAKNNMGTMRARYMAEASQLLYRYEDKENLKFFDISLAMQGSAAVYGTGDTQFIGRIGPVMHSQYKHWMQEIAFFASAFHDGTPMAMYDSYRYGHGNIYIREALRLNKYITVAWSGSLTVTNDSPNNRLFQENSFILGLGPDDFKFNIGYDWVRRQTYCALVIAMDTKGSSIEYDKMVIKNPDRLAKNNDEEVLLKVFDNPENSAKTKAQTKKMMYAEVIDIEDPDKESI